MHLWYGYRHCYSGVTMFTETACKISLKYRYYYTDRHRKQVKQDHSRAISKTQQHTKSVWEEILSDLFMFN